MCSKQLSYTCAQRVADLSAILARAIVTRSITHRRTLQIRREAVDKGFECGIESNAATCSPRACGSMGLLISVTEGGPCGQGWLPLTVQGPDVCEPHATDVKACFSSHLWVPKQPTQLQWWHTQVGAELSLPVYVLLRACSCSASADA